MTRPFRFGVVAPLRTDLPTWLAQVRRIADSGYSTLLMPDFPRLQPAPGPTLATAAALTDLRVGTWVYASPLRPAWSIAWEAHSLSVLTDGRFEMGVGTGRPGIEDELRELDVPDSAEVACQPRDFDPRLIRQLHEGDRVCDLGRQRPGLRTAYGHRHRRVTVGAVEISQRHDGLPYLGQPLVRRDDGQALFAELVLNPWPAGADAHLEAAVGEHRQRVRFPCRHPWRA